MKTKHVCVVALVMLLMGSVAWGHHGISAVFDLKTLLTLKGKVTKLTWGNPHPYVYLNVVDGKGQAQSWSVEFSDLNKLNRAGLTPGSIRAGDQITITAFASRIAGEFSYLDGDSPEAAAHARTNNFARASEVTLSSGKTIVVP